MENTTRNREICAQLRAACEELARGFAQMEAEGEAASPDTWAEAVNALSETLAVARVNWAELSAAHWEGPVARIVRELESRAPRKG